MNPLRRLILWWRGDIAVAPRNGRLLLLWCPAPRRWVTGRWYEYDDLQDGAVGYWERIGGVEVRPTRYRRMPKAPR